MVCAARHFFLIFLSAAIPVAAQQPVVVGVHADVPQGAFRAVWDYFGYDEPNYTYSEHGKKLVGEIYRLGSVPAYIRTHNLLTTGNGTPGPGSGGSTPMPTRWRHGLQAIQCMTGPSQIGSSTPTGPQDRNHWSRSDSCRRRSPFIPTLISTTWPQGPLWTWRSRSSQGLRQVGRTRLPVGAPLH